MAEQTSTREIEAIIKDCEPAIKGIIKSKLRVTLDPSDGRAGNQDALELYGDICLLLAREIEKARAGSEATLVRDFRSYLSVATYNACSQYLREKYPRRNSLKNRLRYFLNNKPGYAVWEDQSGELVCGFASWRGRKARIEKLERMPDSSWQAPLAAIAAKDIDRMNGGDWADLLDAIFNAAATPVELDDLVNYVAQQMGVKDEVQAATERDEEDPGQPFDNLPGTELTPAVVLEQREFLKRLWEEICQMTPGHRIAYLLNFRDADGDIQIFPWNGIATITEIGRALEISDEQFDRVCEALPLNDDSLRLAKSLGSCEERFALLWAYLPIEDAAIARLLGCDRQKVINLRQKARERLARRLKL